MPKTSNKGKKTKGRKAAGLKGMRSRLSSRANGASRQAAKKGNQTSPNQSASLQDKALREHLLNLLRARGAHIDFNDAMADWPAQLAGAKVANFPHTAWMLLEHMRIAQWDILEFSRNPKHKSPKWPDEYWPASESPATERDWTASIAAFKKDLRAFERLISDRKSDLYEEFPWGDGQTLLREALLVADHNAYHLGQLVMLRKCMGI